MRALTKYERQQVGHGEAEQVEVGGGVQVPVGRYDDAGARVAEQPGGEDDAVDDGERQRAGQIAAARPEMSLQELAEIELREVVRQRQRRRIIFIGRNRLHRQNKPRSRYDLCLLCSLCYGFSPSAQFFSDSSRDVAMATNFVWTLNLTQSSNQSRYDFTISY